MLAAGAGASMASGQPAPNPIVLHVDMSVDPAKENEMVKNFHTIFKPAAMKHEGYIDVKILKLHAALMGKAPAGINYRFQLTFRSEALRQKWIASDVHQKVWPTIENTLTTKDYTVLLFDSV